MAVIVLIANLIQKNKDNSKIKIKDWNEKLQDYKNTLLPSLSTKKELKQYLKEVKLEHKNNDPLKKPKAFVIDFNGDIKVSQLENFSEGITAILSVAKQTDEVIVKLESPGGMVHAYGLAASQLQRIKNAGIKLTICVDKVAASGGYMMACLADKLIAAPFAIIGSIGVVANVPNFNRLLKKNDIDYMEMTAGEYKRTVTLLGEITEEGKKKFNEQLKETHDLFKNHIHKFRPQCEISKVATGEYWYGTQALSLGLIDEIEVSDSYLTKKCQSHQVKQIQINKKKDLKSMLIDGTTSLIEKIYEKVLNKNYRSQFDI